MSKYDIIKASLVGVIATVLLKPSVAAAQNFIVCDGGPSDPCTLSHALDLVISIINLAIQLSGVVAVAMITFYGFRMSMAGLTGDSHMYEDAKKGSTAAVTGFIMVLFAYTIVNIVWSLILPDYVGTWFKPWQK